MSDFNEGEALSRFEIAGTKLAKSIKESAIAFKGFISKTNSENKQKKKWYDFRM